MTKAQEREILDQIKTILEPLDVDDSYVARAFEGCVELAEQNIDYDWMESYKRKSEYERNIKEVATAKKNELEKQLDELREKNRKLELQVEDLSEWELYEYKGEMTWAEYGELAKDSAARVLSDDEAKDLVHREYGFDKSLIEIQYTKPTIQKDRRGNLREHGVTDTKPVYSATDWNYVRFMVCGMTYELQNGELYIV